MTFRAATGGCSPLSLNSTAFADIRNVVILNWFEELRARVGN